MPLFREYEIVEWCGCPHTRTLVAALKDALVALELHEQAHAEAVLAGTIQEHNVARIRHLEDSGSMVAGVVETFHHLEGLSPEAFEQETDLADVWSMLRTLVEHFEGGA